MSSFPSARRARRPVVAALAAVLVTLAPAAGHAQGVGFTVRSSNGPDASGASATRVRTRDAVMRFDGAADGRQQGELGDGAYTIVDAGNRRIQIVMPATKQYWEMKFDDSTAMALKTAAAVSMAVTDVHMSGQSLGSGGVVNGMSTNKYRLTTDFSEITMGGSGDQRPRKMHVVEEYWVADALRDVPDPMEQLGRTLGGKGGFAKSPYSTIGGTSLNEFLTQRAAEQRKLFKGFPVRTVTTSEETLPNGQVEKSVSTTEIADVQKGNFDAALFKVPDGYTMFDPRAAMANMGAAFRDALKGSGRGKADAAGAKAADTTSLGDAAKEGAKDAAKEAGKDAAKDAVKGALGGFLRKKKP